MYAIRNKKKIKLTLQDSNYDCGPASLRMFLSYYGFNFTKVNLTKITNTTKEGTDSNDIVSFLKNNHLINQSYDVLEYENNLRAARSLIKKNTPLFICYEIFGKQEYSHYSVCTGFSHNSIVLANPYTDSKNQIVEEYNMNWFKYWWKKTNFWFLILKKK